MPEGIWPIFALIFAAVMIQFFFGHFLGRRSARKEHERQLNYRLRPIKHTAENGSEWMHETLLSRGFTVFASSSLHQVMRKGPFVASFTYSSAETRECAFDIVIFVNSRSMRFTTWLELDAVLAVYDMYFPPKETKE